MAESMVWTFFYGSFINPDVLRKVDIVPERVETARLNGFDIRIAPLANLVRSAEQCVYGTIAQVTHAELARLYQYVRDDLGGVYLPQPVLVETTTGRWLPALCYIAPEMQSAPAADDYVDRIVGPARTYEFPEWYIDRLERFRL